MNALHYILEFLDTIVNPHSLIVIIMLTFYKKPIIYYGINEFIKCQTRLIHKHEKSKLYIYELILSKYFEKLTHC